MNYRALATVTTAAAFQTYLAQQGVDLPFEPDIQHETASILNSPYTVQGATVGNRFSVMPLEGWDCTPDGRPTASTHTRWRNWGRGGAKLIWGESLAVRHDAKSSAKQLEINGQTVDDIAHLRQTLVDAHHGRFGRVDDLLIGTQLTHSGRMAKPDLDEKRKPLLLYHHPFLDRKLGIPDDAPLATDEQIYTLIADFIEAAKLADRAGFDFVDIKSCHGYFGHEILGARTRAGDFGGSFENRTRFLREVITGIQRAVPGLRVAVRVSAFDLIPYHEDDNKTGRAIATKRYPYAFGGNAETGRELDLTEPIALMNMLHEQGVRLVCVTGGSPYHVWHIQKPSRVPTVGDYLPPEEPLASVMRHIHVTAQMKQACPDLTIIGSAYSYLQQWLPHVAQAVIRQGMADAVGMGRLMTKYPEYVSDVLTGVPLNREKMGQLFPAWQQEQP